TDYNLQTTNLTWGSGGQAGTNANITAATITLTAAGNISKVYDASANATVAQNNYQITGLVSGDTAAALTNTGATYNSAHVLDASNVSASGIAIANVTGNHSSRAGDYVLSTTNLTWGSGGQAGTNANITAANLTLASTGNVTKTYDGTANATVGLANLSITGLVSGDSLTLSNLTTAAFNSTHVANASNVTVGNLALATVAGNHTSALSDYSLQTTNLTWNGSTITAANLTLASTGNVTKTYDGTANATVGLANLSITGLVSGDSLTLSNLTTAAFNSTHVANASNVTVGNLALATVAGNHTSALSDYSLQTTNLTWNGSTITAA
ncbi:YDG domain-containing protein, partial [Polynucleobacter sp. Tro8-14-1]|uniref:YDG domain-containing protein n=1 Tax=Polynucleobacter sp. Tro8-14-1 TaxID=1758383 RepID=UPI001C0B5AEB